MGAAARKGAASGNIANTWFDVDKVDVIIDSMNSGVWWRAVSEVARQKNKLFLVTGAETSDLTGPKCSPNTRQDEGREFQPRSPV